LEASRRDWEQLSAAHQQLNFTLTQVQQENDRLCARRFQLELERGDRLQRIVDLEAENNALEEDADAHEIERLTLLQNIAEMQEHVQEAEVQVAALQAIVALQPLPPVQAHPEEQQAVSGLDQTSQAGLGCRQREQQDVDHIELSSRCWSSWLNSTSSCQATIVLCVVLMFQNRVVMTLNLVLPCCNKNA
jgi:chromosome segregation ATPase